MTMLPRERCDYSAVVDRPPLKLPDGARIIFWSIVNLEVWDIGKAMARQVIPPPTGQMLLPDVPNWSWHEYGMRVGVWRFFELFQRLGIKPTLAINARVCEDYVRVAEQAKSDGWEFMGHAYEQGPIHKVDDQTAMIKRTMDVIERFTGEKPVGWLGPGLTETLETPDLLAAAGVKYIGDWVYDDEPTTIRTANGTLVTLPYTLELNDIPMMLVQHHESDYLLKRTIVLPIMIFPPTWLPFFFFWATSDAMRQPRSWQCRGTSRGSARRSRRRRRDAAPHTRRSARDT